MLGTIRDRFVPVAVDQHVHRRLEDAEGKLFAKVLGQAGRGLEGYSQGVYLFAPDGELLEFSNTSDAGRVRRMLASALKKFDPALEVTLEAPETGEGPLPGPPEGGLVLAVTSKVLGGYGDATDRRTKVYAESLGSDRLWLREDEHEALARGELPRSVQERIARYHLVDNTRGEPPFWRRGEMRRVEMSLTDGQVTGSVHLETASGDRGYEAEVLGRVEVEDGKVGRLDLVAKGQFWGHGRYTRNPPPGKFPFAVTFRLAEVTCAADKVPPGGARGNLRAYLR